MNDRIAKGMIEKMNGANIKNSYASLKQEEKELLMRLEELRKAIKIAEKDVITEKLNTALQCLVDVDTMTHGNYRCSIETYCEGCAEDIDVDIDLSEIIETLQQIK